MKQIIFFLFLISSYSLQAQKTYTITGDNFSQKYLDEVLSKISENDTLILEKILSETSLFFENLDFSMLSIKNSNISQIEIVDCKIDDISLEGITYSMLWLGIESCLLNNLIIKDISSHCLISIIDNKIKNSIVLYQINHNQAHVVLDGNIFYRSSEFIRLYGEHKFMPIPFDIVLSDIQILTLSNNKEKVEYYQEYIEFGPTYNIQQSNINTFRWYKDSLSNLKLNLTKVMDNLIICDVDIKENVLIYQSILPLHNSEISWRTFSKKIGTRLSLYGYDFDKDITYQSYNNFADINSYWVYIKTLYQFYNIFKLKGDQESANMCYVEIKEAETAYFKHLLKTEGGFENRLNYYLNLFLKHFAEYGTNPVRSIQISMWVILIFGSFYFFTYSDWDRINRQFFIEKSNQLIKYFTSEQKLEDFYSESYKEDMLSYEAFKKNLKEKRSEVPFFFVLLMKPLYFLSIIKHKLNAWMYRRVEILKGRWVDLKRWKKLTVGTTVFIWSIVYLAYLAAVRGLNSIVLSINTFSTLGFGDIPVRGLARYVAILEGFLGWFLLTIFSVSLISQILQS